MADKPILFSGPRVRALLAGTKTQTRRALNPQPRQGARYTGIHYASDEPDSYFFNTPIGPQKVRQRIAEGDRLYVRETWSGIHAFRNTPPSQRESVMTPDGPMLREDVWFWADGNPDGGDYEKPRPAMHMPRWASRLTLTVTDVRVERLQDITEVDALAEGMTQDTADAIMEPEELAIYAATHILCPDARARILYETIWDQINGDGAWASNPWVAAYTFTVERGNIDRLRATKAAA